MLCACPCANLLLPDDVIEELDRVARPRGRSRYVAEAVRERLRRDERLAAARAAAGSPGSPRSLAAVEFVQPGPDVAAFAGRWRGETRRRGLTLGMPDALVAATTDALGVVLITRNVRDFAITPVQISTY